MSRAERMEYRELESMDPRELSPAERGFVEREARRRQKAGGYTVGRRRTGGGIPNPNVNPYVPPAQRQGGSSEEGGVNWGEEGDEGWGEEAGKKGGSKLEVVAPWRERRKKGGAWAEEEARRARLKQERTKAAASWRMERSTGEEEDDSGAPVAESGGRGGRNPLVRYEAPAWPPAGGATHLGATSFGELGVDRETAEALSLGGFGKPTAIQRAGVGAVLAGRSVALCGETGGGKTLAYGVPLAMRCADMAERVAVKGKPGVTRGMAQGGTAPAPCVLVLCPTVDLAGQVAASLEFCCACVTMARGFGGRGIEPLTVEIMAGKLKPGKVLPRADILVSTPGKVWSLMTAAGRKDAEALAVRMAKRAAAKPNRKSSSSLSSSSSGNGTPTPRARAQLVTEGLVLSNLEAVVLDEADALLSDEYFVPVSGVLDVLQRSRKEGESLQVVLAAATLQRELWDTRVSGLFPAGAGCDRLTTDATHTLSAAVEQRLVGVDSESQRPMQLIAALKSVEARHTLVFVDTPEVANALVSVLAGVQPKSQKEAEAEPEGEPAAAKQAPDLAPGEGRDSVFGRVAAFHGRVGDRMAQLEEFAQGGGVLVCTDLAARGMDLPMVTHVVQYQCAKTVTEYLHRVGRTARTGMDGPFHATTLFRDDTDKEVIASVRRAQKRTDFGGRVSQLL